MCHRRHQTNDRFRESVTQTYEVTLQRPPGLILEQVWDSSGRAEAVVVKGILPGSPAEASGAVECGDKVVAVSSSLGSIMWPYRCFFFFSIDVCLFVGTAVSFLPAIGARNCGPFFVFLFLCV